MKQLRKKLSLLNREWDSTLLDNRYSNNVPARPGVYKIFSIKERIMKIPHGLQIRYIGKAEKSIRSRFLAHSKYSSEHNEDLAKLVNRESLEFWFMELPKEIVSLTEKELIRAYRENNTNELLNKINYINGA
tara:strand:- start:313 stop:708 length:396 start_codon:yes stop_codon:yes gene_type:complete